MRARLPLKILHRLRSRAKYRRVLQILGTLCVGILSAEAAARIDDRLFGDVPLLANPDRQRDLLVNDALGFRGKPNGSFRKWKLNTFGFLGPDIEPVPTATRVMVLGASETFGLYESASRDYPAQLRGLLAAQGRGDVEIVNGGVAGMSLPAMRQYWRAWAGRFGAGIVLIYPSPLFYLDNEVPRAADAASSPPQPTAAEIPGPLDVSRFLTRVKDLARQNPVLKDIRARVMIGAQSGGMEPESLFTADPPRERLAAFSRDLEAMADAVATSGATPVLITHAFKFPSPPEPGDLAQLRYFRLFYPRALPDAMPAFDLAARDTVLTLGQRRGWTVIDAAAALNGRRELFADPVHFTDGGSLAMAQLLAGPLVREIVSKSGRR